jgi:hypothetical protein
MGDRGGLRARARGTDWVQGTQAPQNRTRYAMTVRESGHTHATTRYALPPSSTTDMRALSRGPLAAGMGLTGRKRSHNQAEKEGLEEAQGLHDHFRPAHHTPRVVGCITDSPCEAAGLKPTNHP